MPQPDPANLASWYAAHAAALTLYARQFGPDAGAAEDTVHEAFVSLLTQRIAPGNVRAWLYTTVRNAALSRSRSDRRRERRERSVTEATPEWFCPRPEDLVDAASAQEALAGLTPEQREAVVLRIYAQATFAEIAQITGVPLSTAHDRYKQALAALKRKMESSSCRKT